MPEYAMSMCLHHIIFLDPIYESWENAKMSQNARLFSFIVHLIHLVQCVINDWYLTFNQMYVKDDATDKK